MASRSTGSRRRIIRCWPTGRPRVCSGCSRVKVKIIVSDETARLESRTALVQARGLRKVRRGSLDAVSEAGSERASLAESERVPRW